MYFLIDISEKIRSLDEDDFRFFSGRRQQFFEKYGKRFEKHWDQYCKKKKIHKENEGDEWAKILREMRNWDEQELEYMYKQIMSLGRKFGGKKYNYFEIETHSGGVTVPDKPTILLRLMELSDKLLYEIYPSITKLLSYHIKEKEIETPSPRGTILIQKTIMNAIKNSGGIPTTFVCSIPDRTFNTPENRLLLIAIKSIQNDALQIFQDRKQKFQDEDDKRKVWNIINKTQNILDLTPLHEIKETIKALRLSIIPASKLKKILDDVEKDLERRRVRQAEYANLLIWIRNYIDFNANRYKGAVNFTLENTKNIDEMFELWGIFQFVNYISNNFPGVRCIPYGVKDKRNEKYLKLKGFKITRSGQKLFNIAYENSFQSQVAYRRESGSTMKPDYSIEYDENNRPIILDAKNWTHMNRTDALYKMEHYVTNFQYEYRSEIGILFFPKYEKGDDRKKPKTTDTPLKIRMKKEQMEFVQEFRFLTYVIKATRDPQYRRQLDEVFAEICGLIPALS